MNLSPDDLLQRLGSLTADEAAARWVVAFSGGIDSTVLLHALATSSTSLPIVAVHVDHGLHEQSGEWAAHCAEVAGQLSVDFLAERVQVDTDLGLGPEAAAREARYGALMRRLETGDCLLSGHHQDDQAETLLLNLVRGSGPAGLAGIGASRPLGQGRLLRPLLGVSGSAIEDYARRHGLRWIEDPSNLDTRLDRNFLRCEIMPLLASRWPAAADRLRRSAMLAGEAAGLMNDLADIDLAACGRPDRLDVAALERLSPPRQRNLLRRAVRRCGLTSIPATRLEQAVTALIPARPDARPLVTWQGGELRRYRGEVFVMYPMSGPDAAPSGMQVAAATSLGPSLGTLRLRESPDGGIRPALAAGGLVVRYREGGEQIRLDGKTRKLKKLLQASGILPWMRDRLPLLYAGDELVAVGDLWVSDTHHAVPGFVVEWADRPPIR
jgi:tRNA(Ile)-lysidine synthase